MTVHCQLFLTQTQNTHTHTHIPCNSI